jgi:uncharacterized protein
VLTRGRERTDGVVRYVMWDGPTMGDWVQEINGAFTIMNLTGRSVN